MKNIITFYLLILIPLALLVFGAKWQYISEKAFFVLLMIYALAYHPFISGLRLVTNKKIPMSSFWLNFVPFWNLKYFRFLFFNENTHQHI
jgi:hypothetical protein